MAYILTNLNMCTKFNTCVRWKYERKTVYTVLQHTCDNIVYVKRSHNICFKISYSSKNELQKW